MDAAVTVSVVIPTLSAGEPLAECLRSVADQTYQPLEVVVVDNSGASKVRADTTLGSLTDTQVLEPGRNLGFGGAVNEGVRASSGAFVLVLNDDAVLAPDAVEQLVGAARRRYEIGMCAPQIRLAGTGMLDSAGMLISRDGIGKQRGHNLEPSRFVSPSETLFPSGCAALYRREMLDEIGLFADDYFLYCEDTDLGLRARWKAWECRYVPGAIVEHRFSESAGKASALKAYYVERNRIYTIVRNYPLSLLLKSPWYTAARFFWHWRFLKQGVGAASQYKDEQSLYGIVLRAWVDALRHLPSLVRQRRSIRKSARLTPKQFIRMLNGFRIGARQVAGQ